MCCPSFLESGFEPLDNKNCKVDIKAVHLSKIFAILTFLEFQHCQTFWRSKIFQKYTGLFAKISRKSYQKNKIYQNFWHIKWPKLVEKQPNGPKFDQKWQKFDQKFDRNFWFFWLSTWFLTFWHMSKINQNICLFIFTKVGII